MKSFIGAIAAFLVGVSFAIPDPSTINVIEPHPLTLRRLGSAKSAEVFATVNWTDIIATSRTETTLQVVANPLLDRSVPVSTAFFKSLAELSVSGKVRYVPWFPYPYYGVATLEPPTASSTSWNFTYIQPMLEDFFAATEKLNKTSIPNFSTQPTWMYNTKDWSYPSNPKATDFGYPRGNELNDPTGQQLVEYYQRLLSWIVKGSFKDEHGVEHTGGPAVPIQLWEVFNEPQGCHGMTPSDYTDLYDKIVVGIQEAVDGITFVGGALDQNDEDGWAEYFLNKTNHPSAAAWETVANGYVSFHFYASANSRTDPQAYEAFFPQSDNYFATVLTNIVNARNTMSPTTKLDADELGVILPDDNSPTAPQFPLVYWNAAAAKYAYVFAHMAKMGVEVAGESQLAGSPPIPEWGIIDAQFPSVALLNWTTGAGTARYWVLDMLSRELPPGYQLAASGISSDPICGVVDGHVSYGNLSIQCTDESATISSIDFAAFGTPYGTCGDYHHNASCDASNVTDYVKAHCLGQHSCSILSYPTFGDPCYGTFKQLVIQAQCSTGGGSASGGPTGIFVQGFQLGKTRKVLFINKESTPTTIDISKILTAQQTGTLQTVDESTGFGPPKQSNISGGKSIDLTAFAVAILSFTASS